MKRLFWDIETSPNLVLAWKTGYDLDIPFSNIVKDRAMVAIGWKWQGEKKVRAITWDQNQNDRDMIKFFIPILAEADEVVAHYGDSFDLKWFRGRCMKHGLLASLPPITTVDTFKWARRMFLLNSNKLDYLAQFTGVGSKIKTDYSLWKSIMLDRCEKSMRRMVRYLKRDVRILEGVYDQMSIIAPLKTHAGVLAGNPKTACPLCASSNTEYNRKKISATGSPRFQMRCKDCYRFFTVSETAYKGRVK